MTSNRERAEQLLDELVLDPSVRSELGAHEVDLLERALDEATARGRCTGLVEAAAIVCGGGEEQAELHARYCTPLLVAAGEAAGRDDDAVLETDQAIDEHAELGGVPGWIGPVE